jgi:hypothetical protein
MSNKMFSCSLSSALRSQCWLLETFILYILAFSDLQCAVHFPYLGNKIVIDLFLCILLRVQFVSCIVVLQIFTYLSLNYGTDFLTICWTHSWAANLILVSFLPISVSSIQFNSIQFIHVL